MRQGLLHSVAPILAGPWRQRRNAGSLWGLGTVVFMIAIGPVALFCWSLFVQFGGHDGPAGSLPAMMLVADLRHTAANVSACALAVMALGWWAVTVSNLLDQNLPVLARLVPEHPARLRAALVVAWVAAVAFVTLCVGVRFDVVLPCAAVSTVGLAFLAASVRWPMLWLLGCVAPIVVNTLMAWPGLPAAVETVQAWWLGQPGLISGALAAASAVFLMGLIQAGGNRHAAAHDARRTRVERFRMRAQGVQPVAEGTRGHLDAMLTRPYYAWWRFTFSRQSPPLFGRLMQGLGPGAHWTATLAAVVGTALLLAVGLGVAEVLGLFYAPAARFAPDALASLSVGFVVGVLSPAMQIQSRLYQSRREQALLALLPGLPRGAALNRRLALQLTGQFALAWVGALALMSLSLATAHALRPEVVRPVLLYLCRLFAIGAVPMVVFQWRAWSRVGEPSALSALGPMLLGGLVVAIAWAGSFIGCFSLGEATIFSWGAAFAWCAMRWVRMGREPSALPVGRIA